MNRLFFVFFILLSVTQSWAETLECAADPGSYENIKVTLETDAFETFNLTGTAAITISNANEEIYNIKTRVATYQRFGGHHLFTVPLRNKKDGVIRIYFRDSFGGKAYVQQYLNQYEASGIANINCRR